jgi:hypothetical protein
MALPAAVQCRMGSTWGPRDWMEDVPMVKERPLVRGAVRLYMYRNMSMELGAKSHLRSRPHTARIGVSIQRYIDRDEGARRRLVCVIRYGPTDAKTVASCDDFSARSMFG